MPWTAQQNAAISSVSRWLHNSDKPVYRLFGYAGTGKALRVGSMVQTPGGPIPIEFIQPGDEVFGRDGHATTVVGVFPQGRHITYRVKFRDGAEVFCNDEHLWCVGRSKNRGWVIKTTKELRTAGVRWESSRVYKWKVPLCDPVAYPDAAPSDPYIIGLLIGDGHTSSKAIQLTSADEFIVSEVSRRLPEGMVVASRGIQHIIKDTTDCHYNRLKAHIESLGLNVLAKEKFIPRKYLTSITEDRISLLRGIMDADGSCCNNRTSLSTTSKRLAKDITELVNSLGGTAITRHYSRKDRKSVEYQINIKTPMCPFLLPRKAGNWRPSTKNPPSRYITSIEEVGMDDHVCIAVSSEDNLFLTDGFVATHNTTLAKHLAEQSDGATLFCAYTGKAAYVLRQKGCEAFTIHQLIYQAKDKSQAKLRELEAELADTDDAEKIAKLEELIAIEHKKLNSPNFVLNPDSPVKTANLVVVDECSMVNQQMAEDLLSFGTKVLVLGDPAQLPPVYGAGWFIKGDADFMLTEIHRQAKDNPIIGLATRIRNREDIEPDGDMIVSPKSITPEIALSYDQILVGRNIKRKAINRRVRTLLGFGRDIPMEGDKLVCLRNDHEVGLLNGSLWKVDSCFDAGDDFLDLIVKDPEYDAGYVAVQAHRHYFMSDSDKPIPYWIRKEAQEFDYGYALTVHKSQGSAWDSVLIFDESSAFGKDRYKWLYTAVTRAAKKVTVVLQ